MPRAASDSAIRGSSDDGNGAKVAGLASTCRTAVMRGPVSSEVKSSSRSSRSGMAHPMFRASELSNSRASCQSVGVPALRILPPLGWTALIAWFSTGGWSADATGSLLLPLLRWLLPEAAPEQLEAMHWLVRKAAHATEYGVLAVLWRSALDGREAWRSWLVPLGLSVLT